jgi:hypothetical protein
VSHCGDAIETFTIDRAATRHLKQMPTGVTAPQPADAMLQLPLRQGVPINSS